MCCNLPPELLVMLPKFRAPRCHEILLRLKSSLELLPPNMMALHKASLLQEPSRNSSTARLHNLPLHCLLLLPQLRVGLDAVLEGDRFLLTPTSESSQTPVATLPSTQEMLPVRQSGPARSPGNTSRPPPCNMWRLLCRQTVYPRDLSSPLRLTVLIASPSTLDTSVHAPSHVDIHCCLGCVHILALSCIPLRLLPCARLRGEGLHSSHTSRCSLLRSRIYAIAQCVFAHSEPVAH